MKVNCRWKGINPKTYLVIFLLSLLGTVGCTRYATKDEMLEYEKMKLEVFNLEKEVKSLKEEQIELVNLRSKILKELDECKKSRKLQDLKN